MTADPDADRLKGWLERSGLASHAPAFARERIGFDQLHRLSDAELRELGLTLGDRLRFRQALAAPPAAPPAAPSADAERRPLTIAFLDLVNSTGLSARLEPEDLLETLRRYHEACAAPIQRYGGRIAQFLGDGILAYFGYPQAHEDDPERAVRAALEAVAAVAALPVLGGPPLAVLGGGPPLAVLGGGPPLAARAGIATGRVVIGDLFGPRAMSEIGAPSQALGSTPNLAARLQSLAPPGGVVIASETAARLRDRIALEDLGPRMLAGFPAPLRVFRALGERQRGAGAARGVSRVTRFVGREAELAALHARWDAALAGHGGAMLIRGEAGIGKSKLARRFLVTRRARGATATLAIAGSPFHGDDPLRPVATALRGLAHHGAGDLAHHGAGNFAHHGAGDAQAAMERLRRLLLPEPGAEEEARLAAVAELVGLAGAREEALLQGATPQRRRALPLDALAQAVARHLRQRPLLLLVEDAHWLDPTTLELVERVIAEAGGQRLLVLLTARESFVPPDGKAWAGLGAIELRGLPPAEAARLYATLCAGSAAARLGQDLAERTGGVPLFIVEFARAVAEHGACEPGTAPPPAIPATLHECLAARLDRAGPAKAVAQAASVLGQEGLRIAPLARVAGLAEPAVGEALLRLEEAGILRRGHGAAADAWSFRHALLREAAYDSLLRERRRALHGRAADALTTQADPGILALHLSEAGRAAESLPHYLAAARHSLARSALHEATRLLRRGLAIASTLTDGPEARERRLELAALLGPALVGLYGAGTPEVQRLYEEAVALARSMPPRAEHFPIFWGWWRLSHVHDFHESRARAARLYADTRERGDQGLLLQAHHCNWAALFQQGDLRGSERHVRDGLGIYCEAEHGGHAALYGNHDAKVCAHAHQALGLWQRGRAREAAAEDARAAAWAHRLSNIGSVLHAMEFSLLLSAYRRQPAEVMAAADRLAAHAGEQGYDSYRNRCHIFQGWAMAMGGEARRGAALATESLARERQVNSAEDFAVFHCLGAEAWAAAGEPDRALAELRTALAEFERIGLAHWVPEVWRTIGDLTLRVDPRDAAAAGHAYAEAGRLAEAQGAHRLGLRAAIGAGRLALRLDAGREAAALRLAETRARVAEMEEGAEEARAAEALLRELRAPRRSAALLDCAGFLREPGR